MSKNICEIIAGWFAPQTTDAHEYKAQPEAPFDWHSVLENAKLELSKTAKKELVKFKKELEKAKEDFKIEITSYRNKTIKIIREGQIDVIPIEDIRKVTLNRGGGPKIVESYYTVNKDGSYFEDSFYINPDNPWICASKAIEAKPDVIKISPIMEISCPFGLADSILNKIQELMAE